MASLNQAPVELLFMLLFLFATTLVFAYAYFSTHHKAEQLRRERDQLRNDNYLQELEMAELTGRLEDANSAIAKQEQAMQRLSTELGKSQQQVETAQQTAISMRTTQEVLAQQRDELEQRCQELQATIDSQARQHDSLAAQLHECMAERDSLAQRFAHLDQIDADVWLGPSRNGAPLPAFVPRQERGTRLVTFLNLKGGVGKTTLVANLAAAYATGVAGKPLRVLAVDLDYQGTLSNMCVAIHLLEDRRRQSKRTSALLLEDGQVAAGSEHFLEALKTEMSGTAGKGRVIVADEMLDHIDFRQQARFAVEGREVRYHFRQVFHSREVFDQFDLVFFDSPPRLTASSINALLASDWIVIPTALHANDVDAVPRTLAWLEKLQQVKDMHCKLAGIVLNRTFREGTLDNVTREEASLLDRLFLLVEKHHGLKKDVIPHLVKNSPEVARYSSGDVPFGTTAEGHEFFRDVARELHKRIMG